MGLCSGYRWKSFAQNVYFHFIVSVSERTYIPFIFLNLSLFLSIVTYLSYASSSFKSSAGSSASAKKTKTNAAKTESFASTTVLLIQTNLM